MASVPVNSGILFAGRGGLSARIFLPIWLGLVAGLLGHIANKAAEKKVSRQIQGVRCQVSGKTSGAVQLGCHH